MNKVLCVFVACFAAAASLITDKCPPRESLRCYCKVSAQGPKVFCNTINSLEVLQGKLKALEGYAVDFLELKYVSSAFPADLFKGLHIKTLKMFDLEVSEESSFLPDFGLESSLEKLDLDTIRQENNSVTIFKFDHYQSLKDIKIDDILISEVGNDWFANGPKTLTSLELRRNELKTLGDRAFSSLTNLRDLNIRNNLLTEISRSSLPSPATHLQTLHLSSNKISSLPSDFFSDMPSLKRVYLTWNEIHALPEDTWSPIISNLAEAWLGYRLKCDQDMRWICDKKIFNAVWGYCSGHTRLEEFCENSSEIPL